VREREWCVCEWCVCERERERVSEREREREREEREWFVHGLRVASTSPM
jgi:hypothetical protein